MTQNAQTLHGKERHAQRMKQYKKHLNKGRIVSIQTVDKGHVNGKERHVIHSNRLVYVYNLRTGLFITVLYARDGQLKRYGLDPKDFDAFIQGLNYL